MALIQVEDDKAERLIVQVLRDEHPCCHRQLSSGVEVLSNLRPIQSGAFFVAFC